MNFVHALPTVCCPVLNNMRTANALTTIATNLEKVVLLKALKDGRYLRVRAEKLKVFN